MEIIITALLGQAYRAPLRPRWAPSRSSFTSFASVLLNLVFSAFYNLVTYNVVYSAEHLTYHPRPEEWPKGLRKGRQKECSLPESPLAQERLKIKKWRETFRSDCKGGCGQVSEPRRCHHRRRGDQKLCEGNPESWSRKQPPLFLQCSLYSSLTPLPPTLARLTLHLLQSSAP